MQGDRAQHRWGTAGKSGFFIYSDLRVHLKLKINSPVLNGREMAER